MASLFDEYNLVRSTSFFSLKFKKQFFLVSIILLIYFVAVNEWYLTGHASLSNTITASWCCNVKNLSTQNVLTALLKSAVLKSDADGLPVFLCQSLNICNIEAGSERDVIPQLRIWFIYLQVCLPANLITHIHVPQKHTDSALQCIKAPCTHSFVGFFPPPSLTHIRTVIPPSP